MKQIRLSHSLKRSCALITVFTLLFQIILPLLSTGLSAAFAAESGDDGSAGSANYYQQELEKFGKGSDHVGASGAMTYSYPMGDVAAAYNSEGGWSIGTHSRIARSSKWGVPTYSDEDIFTLDGRELVSAGGSNPRIYHTDQESYRKIEYHNPGNADSFWKVYNQDGTVGPSMAPPLTHASTPSGNPQSSPVFGRLPNVRIKAAIPKAHTPIPKIA